MLALKNKSGFSLVEILVALSLIGIILAFSIPNFTEYNRGRMVESAARRIVSDMRMLRTIAISQHHLGRIVFSPDNLSYTMYVDRNDDYDFDDPDDYYGRTDLSQHFSGIRFVRMSGISDIPLYVDPFGGTDAISFQGDDDSGSLETQFLYDGKVNQSGAIFLASDSDVEAGDVSGQYLVEVYRIGSVKWWRYNGDRWLSF